MRTSRLRKIAVPLIAVLLLMVVYEYGYLRIRADLEELRQRQSVRMQILNRSVELISRTPELEKQLAVLKEEVKSRRGNLIAGESLSIGNANLQGIVKGIVTERGGIISSERIAAPEDLGKSPNDAKEPQLKEAGTPKRKTGFATAQQPKQSESGRLKVLNVSIDGGLPDTAALSDMLYSLETRTPYLAVKELDVRVKNLNQSRELMIRLNVSGLYGGK